MTAIVIIKTKKGRVIMAGDRKLTYDWSLATSMPGPKIRKDADTGILIGAAGSGNLATVLVNLTKVPDLDLIDVEIYMHFKFKKALIKALLEAGYKDQHNQLMIPEDYGCDGLVVVRGRAFMVDIKHPDWNSNHGNVLGGIVEIEETGFPYAVGCGAASAYPILLAEKKREGYSTKEHLTLAMEIAADIAPGVDKFVDFISE